MRRIVRVLVGVAFATLACGTPGGTGSVAPPPASEATTARVGNRLIGPDSLNRAVLASLRASACIYGSECGVIEASEPAWEKLGYADVERLTDMVESQITLYYPECVTKASCARSRTWEGVVAGEDCGGGNAAEVVDGADYPVGSDTMDEALDVALAAGWFGQTPPPEWRGLAGAERSPDAVIVLACFESCTRSDLCTDALGEQQGSQGGLAQERCRAAEEHLQRWFGVHFPTKFLLTAQIPAACDIPGAQNEAQAYRDQRVTLLIPLSTALDSASDRHE